MNRVERAVRRSVTIPCQVVRERDFRLVSHAMVDLSLEGMLAVADGAVLTGESVVVSFRAPLATGWIDALGFVARVDHGRRLGDRGTRLGIAFEWLDRQSGALLERQLGWFAPARARVRRFVPAV